MPEKQNEEYKESWSNKHLKWICAFANAQGGNLYIGIDDKENITGLPEKDIKKLLEDLPNMIKDKLGISSEINLLESNSKKYIEIVTSPYTVPISYEGHYYIRIGSTTRELTGNSLNEFLLNKSGRTWDDAIEPRATMNDIDQNSFNVFLASASTTGRLPDITGLTKEEIFEKLRLSEDGKLKRAAIILFGKDPNRFYPGINIKIGRFGKDHADLIFQEDNEGNLITLLKAVMDQLNSKFLIRIINYQGIQRTEKDQYPIVALREVLLNALVHRSYIGVAHTQISVYDDKMMFWNDGELPNGLSLNSLKEEHKSKPRNPIIAAICFRAGYIESWGRGTLKVLQSAKDSNLPEPLFEEKDGGFMVTLYNGLTTAGTSGGTTAGTSGGTTAGTSGGTTAENDIIKAIIDDNFNSTNELKSKLYTLLNTIYETEGKRTNEYKGITGFKARTLDRYFKKLAIAGLIEFKGANQLGGYYLTDKTKNILNSKK